MDTYSSGEDLIIKTRKPYTITKQRERWTEEEHNRFLEALKLYGRAWQRIEEHIGTKTAVQIRSHAQKFFSKLEKEALAKGIPISQALDIDIPPPRPKRKPNNPYPRKTGVTASTAQLGAKDGKPLTTASSSHCNRVLDLEKEPLPERTSGDDKPTNARDNQGESCSEVFTLLREANCSSVSSVNKSPIPTSAVLRNSCTLREFVPSLKEKLQDNGTSKASNFENSFTSSEISVQVMEKHDSDDALPTDEIQATQNYPRHVPVHVVEGRPGSCTQTPTEMPFQDSILHPVADIHVQPSLFANPPASTLTDQNNSPRPGHQAFPSFHPPLTPICPNQEDYRSFLHMSSTFSSLIVSTLLQNPAAHAAASFAATFWPYSNVGTSVDSAACSQGSLPSRQMNSAPSMAAIAAATVAAATAWWAAHGLLPVCAPLHNGFTCAPASISPMDTNQAPASKTERKENADLNLSVQEQHQDSVDSEALQAQLSVSKSPTLSTSDSEECGDARPNTGARAADHKTAEAVTELRDANKTKGRKQVDRSSCGSNTPTGSEAETEALQKLEKGKEETKEADANHPATEASNRRSRSSSNLSDSWKEVSEEGRLAFQALFSREVLPQSFSPKHAGKTKGQQQDNVEEDKKTAEKDGDASALDLNSNTLGTCSDHHQGVEKKPTSTGENKEEDGLLTIGLGHGKLKARRTGFKPYKRCSIEAKENILLNTNSHVEEKGPKRIRLEGEAST
ncbi:hypothetical protein SLEP1_g2179 [Rubroshorea leprosula]|uniref:LHY n=1 Tax=Rubroshorea leprosula TaxID=152421 RepID=A0AAV5HM70_9ROSI|nr:hypothetical protein SLEP1_g2179 [Rubroshorea leprosula]